MYTPPYWLVPWTIVVLATVKHVASRVDLLNAQLHSNYVILSYNIPTVWRGWIGRSVAGGD